MSNARKRREPGLAQCGLKVPVIIPIFVAVSPCPQQMAGLVLYCHNAAIGCRNILVSPIKRDFDPFVTPSFY